MHADWMDNIVLETKGENIMREQKLEYNYHKFLNTLVVMKNIITLICFTVLAISFGKWWIVLFALLFMSYIGKSDKEKVESEDKQ